MDNRAALVTLLFITAGALAQQQPVRLPQPIPEMQSVPKTRSERPNGHQVTFVPAKQLLADIRKAPEQRPSISWLLYFDTPPYTASVIRRTAPDRSEVHRDVTEVQYVIKGGGSLVTGGSLTEAVQGEPGEFRGRGIDGGEERHLASGDLIIIPAGTPHWIRSIGGNEIVYLSVKSTAEGQGPPVTVANQIGEELPAVKKVLAADDARRQAMLRGDVHALDSLLADDATVVWGDGTTDNKPSILELFRSGRLRYEQLDYENNQVRMFGDIAIITGDARVKVASDGDSIASLVRVTRVYASQQDQWRLVAVQTTRAATSSAASLTGKMAIYNSLLGKPWTCTADLPAMSGQPAHMEKDNVTFSVAPHNALLVEVSSPQFEGRNFIGFDSKSNQYWRTETGVFGGIMRETSPDGTSFSGKSSMGGDWEPVRSVLTTIQPDGSSSDTEWWTRNGTELTFTSRCTR